MHPVLTVGVVRTAIKNQAFEDCYSQAYARPMSRAMDSVKGVQVRIVSRIFGMMRSSTCSYTEPLQWFDVEIWRLPGASPFRSPSGAGRRYREGHQYCSSRRCGATSCHDACVIHTDRRREREKTQKKHSDRYHQTSTSTSTSRRSARRPPSRDQKKSDRRSAPARPAGFLTGNSDQ